MVPKEHLGQCGVCGGVRAVFRDALVGRGEGVGWVG